MKDELRFQHLLFVGGSGCGKSTLIQEFLVEDIKRAKKGKCTIIHIDPVQANDLIIEHAKVERYSNAILIDAADIDSLPCLDIFETSSARSEKLRAANLIGVFTSVCAGLIDADLSSQMKTLFMYCARVAVRLENPSLTDLMELLANPLQVLDNCKFGHESPEYQFFYNQVVGPPGHKGRLTYAGHRRISEHPHPLLPW